jgi:hypothetical protein
MKRILQIAAPALALVLVLALAVPALAASTCNTGTAASACSNVSACLAKNNLAASDILSKLKECGLSTDILGYGPVCLNGADCTTPDCIKVNCDGTQCTTAADCATTACADKAEEIVTEETAVEAASYQAEDEAVIDEAIADQAAANETLVQEDSAAVESTVNDYVKGILSDYASGKSGSCPTGSVVSSGNYSTGSNSSCPKSGSDIQSAASKLLEQAGRKSSCSNGESAANVSDILSQLQNGGYSICNK